MSRLKAVLDTASAVATPFGALGGGAAASAVGPGAVIAVAGGGFLVLALSLASVPAIRRLPAVADIDQLAADTNTP